MPVAFDLTEEGYVYWLQNNPEAAPNTQRRYATSLRNLTRWGIRYLSDVTTPALAKFVTSRLARDGVARATVNGDLAALLAIMSAWVPLDEAQLEPIVLMTRKVRIRGLRRPKRRRARFLTVEEVERLCASARQIEPRLELAIRLAVLTGLRQAELCRIRAEDVHGRVLHLGLDESLGEYGRIKTGEERTVSLCEPARRLLAEAPRRGFVLPSGKSARRGRKPKLPHVSTDVLWAGLKRVRDHAGLPWVTWPILRHTRASWLAQGGCPKLKIAAWLGNSEEVVETFYIGLADLYDPDCERMPPSESAPAA